MNEPTFFSFRKPSDWSNGASYHLQNDKTGMEISREQIYKQVKRTTLTFPQEHEPIIDTLIAADGRWYMLDESGNIWRTDPFQSMVELVMTIHMEHGYKPARMIMNKEDIIVLLNSEHGSMLQSYLIEQAQLKWSTLSWYNDSFTCLEIVADGQDGVAAIGYLSTTNNVYLLRFDAIGEPILNVQLPQHQSLGENESNNYQLITDHLGSIFVFDVGEKHLLRWQLSNNSFSKVAVELPFSDVKALCYDQNHHFWALIISSEEEQGCELFAFNSEGQRVKQGKLELATGQHIEAARHNLYIWNEQKKEIYTVTPASETTYWSERQGHIGAWCSYGLDSGELGTEWHKVKLNVKKLQDTQWNVHYYASDQADIIIDNKLYHLDELIRDEALDASQKLMMLSPIWSTPLKEAEDALLHGAIGRYLWIYIELIGSSMHSPVVQSLEVYFPRSSYLAYLPSIYQRGTSSQQFLSRYLSIFQSMIEDTDVRISSVSRTLEGNQASGESLRWLLSWLGIESEDYWSEVQLRELLREAPKLYRMRGTKYAIETLVKIYTGHPPIVLEYEQIKPLKENIELGEVAERLYAADPHAFNVLVKAEHVDTELKRVTLQSIIESYKPVFSTFKLVVLQPWVYMDLHSYLGMNTVLSEPTLLTLDGRSSMPHHTITIDIGQENRMDKHTRLGLNSRLE